MDGPNNAAHVGIKGATLDPALVRIGLFTQKLPLCRPSGTFLNKVGTRLCNVKGIICPTYSIRVNQICQN